jgi:predicted transcriptional regulator
MMKEIKIREYLAAITGDREVLRFEGTASVDLPRYVSGLYDLRDVALLNIPAVVAILRPVTLPSVIDLERHFEMLKTRSQKEVMFVFDSIPARTAERLISRRIPHIVVGKQVFLPFLLVDIKSAGNLRVKVSLPNTTKLGPWTESLIIRQLLDRDLEGTTGTEIARKMNTSFMTAQRAVSQLKAANLCRFEEQGKKHILRFDDQGSLWEKSSKILLPPLSMTLALSEVPKGLQTFVSGVSALAKSTLLAEDEIPVLATSRRNYARVEKKVTVPIEDAKFLLEVWDRDPALTAKDGVVDPISLYLNMRHGDDRVRIALADLLRSFGLGELS